MTIPLCSQYQSWSWLPRPAPWAAPVQVPSRWPRLESGPFGQKPYQSQMLGRAWRAHYTAASPSVALQVLSLKCCAAPSSHPNLGEAPESGVRLQPLPLCRKRHVLVQVCLEGMSQQKHFSCIPCPWQSRELPAASVLPSDC